MNHIQRKPVPIHSEKPLPADVLKEKETGSDVERASTDLDRPPPIRQKSVKILGWQVSAQKSPEAPIQSKTGSPFAQKFDRRFPPHKTYFGMSRKILFCVLAATVALILGLIIGLSVGLTKSGSKHQNVPLPKNAEKHTGDLTYYAPGLGACGITNSASDSIVAISHIVFDAVQKGSNPNANPLCGKKIRASRYNEETRSQRSVDVTVTDRCVGCKPDDIDVTTSVFEQLADIDVGRTTVTWAWLDVNM